MELAGSGKLHAPFLTERRTRSMDQRIVAGNPGMRTGRDDNFVAKLGSAVGIIDLRRIVISTGAKRSGAAVPLDQLIWTALTRVMHRHDSS